jgi:hypothetical protein
VIDRRRAYRLSTMAKSNSTKPRKPPVGKTNKMARPGGGVSRETVTGAQRKSGKPSASGKTKDIGSARRYR